LLAAALGALAVGFAVALAVPGPLHTYFLESNLMPVLEGQVYRSAQPEPDDLARWIQTLGLRSILNLRGELGNRRLREERHVAASLGVAHYDIHLDADRMPPAPLLREVVEVLDHAPRPLLLHCKGGVERSGLVGAVTVLLAGGDLDTARHQFDVSKGFVPFIANSDLPRVIDEYAAWLAAQGAETTPERFRTWVKDVYAPGFYRAVIEPLDVPAAIEPGAPRLLHFRVTNESLEPIPFGREGGRGVHLGARLEPPPGSAASPVELRGLAVDLQLASGASAELALPLPGLDGAGAWRLDVDLVDEGVKWFAAMGSRPLVLPLVVRAPEAARAEPPAAPAPAARAAVIYPDLR